MTSTQSPSCLLPTTNPFQRSHWLTSITTDYFSEQVCGRKMISLFSSHALTLCLPQCLAHISCSLTQGEWVKGSRRASGCWKTVDHGHIPGTQWWMALNLGENWELGMLTWTQVENSNFEQRSLLPLDLLTNVHNVNKSKRPLHLPWASLSSAHNSDRWGQPRRLLVPTCKRTRIGEALRLTQAAKKWLFSASPPHSEAPEQNKSHPLPRPRHVISSQSASRPRGWGNEGPTEVSNLRCLRIHSP